MTEEIKYRFEISIPDNVKHIYSAEEQAKLLAFNSSSAIKECTTRDEVKAKVLTELGITAWTPSYMVRRIPI